MEHILYKMYIINLNINDASISYISMPRVTLSWPLVSYCIVRDYDEIRYCQASFEEDGADNVSQLFMTLTEIGKRL